MIITLAVLSVVFYAFAAWQLTRRFQAESSISMVKTPTRFSPSLRWAGSALVLHAVVLYHEIYLREGFNLGVFNAISLTAWTIATLVVLTATKRPIENLGVLVWPLAGLTIVIALLFPDKQILSVNASLGVKVHVVFSILAYSALAIAACQAVSLYISEYQLRHRRSGVLLRVLPPLQTQETILIQLIVIGIFLLSLGLLSGVMFVHDFFAQHLLHKTILSLLAWLEFAVILWGRWLYGWRGRTLVRLFLIGFVVLALAYFGSKFVLEIILGRSWIGPVQ